MLEIKNLSFSYDNNGKEVSALKDIVLSIEKGDFMSIVASSGAGKTTLLKLIAGLLQPTRGEILLHNKKITKPSKERGLVFQQFSLFPWLTVKENVAFGLKLESNFDKDWKKYQKDFNTLEYNKTRDELDSLKKSMDSDPGFVKLTNSLSSAENNVNSPGIQDKQKELEDLKSELFRISVNKAIFPTEKEKQRTTILEKIKGVFK